ncbi:DNA polymerase III subunit gamma/tau [Desulfobotulus sp. H1]|uniref:DNA polymerase III subunit gamma/tau n=1 Tax=Desulfobotulus pelophilus TaxID=2823377 RepID=A0ABT3N5I9_9BACT|nr:DNA polymerase III subunit gamma/tau [Desulfobotulus pelophilus]MCW7752724.1 DNA polymerase III subunit gamma/tau [Desulfobotulus pelophilus]
MSYLVLARKYRSQSFSEIIAQEHVSQTLQNAILADRIAHAILFCGPRGTGKTSIARILAKAMNCAEGPSPNPCNQCRSCREITAGNGVDVMEIDGASNNSVDQIRDLREGLGYMPAHSRYRIYIIDEVHMLSTAAFNALLKTLEEPPAHVLFFFATTEPHKIPLTILSRCQRHDLRRVSTPLLTSHLATLCKAESVELDNDGLDMIAREADGSVRDALSLLDRVIAGLDSSQGSRENVAAILGIAARSQSFQITEAILHGNTETVFSIIRELHDAGVDFKKFHADIASHIRNLLVVKVSHQNCMELLDIPETSARDLIQQAGPASAHYLSRLLDMLMAEEHTLRHASHPRIAMETLLLRCLRLKPALSIDRLVERLDALRNDILDKSEQDAPLSSRKSARMEDKIHANHKTNVDSHPPNAFGIPSPALADPATPETHETATEQFLPPLFDPETVSEHPHHLLSATSSPQPYGDYAIRPSPPFTKRPDSPPQGNVSLPVTAEPPQTRQVQADSPQASPKNYVPAKSNNLVNPEEGWKLLIARLRKASPSMGELLATKTALKKLDDQSMEVEVQGSGYSVSRLSNEKTRQLVEQLIHEIFGNPLQLTITTTGADGTEALHNQSEKELLRNEAATHALVQDALEIFKGRVAEISFL